MSSAHLPSPRIIVVGVDTRGGEVVRLELGHGEDPTRLLAVHGWRVRLARDVRSHPVEAHWLIFSFRVERSFAEPVAVAQRAAGAALLRDEDLVTVEGEVPQRHRRVAAYAVVTSSRGVLMTQFSDRTNAQGQWGLPGGGIEAGEAPDRAAVREAWEESGQVIEVNELARVHTSHWIGRAPTGRLEDFHAVRVVYRASCPVPTDPVVYDVGGTTVSAAWVPPANLDRLDLTASWRSLMSDLVRPDLVRPDPVRPDPVRSDILMASDEADGSEHDEHDADGDNRARSQL